MSAPAEMGTTMQFDSRPCQVAAAKLAGFGNSVVTVFRFAGRLLAAVLAALIGVGAPACAQEIPGFIRDTEIENLLNDYARPIFKVAGLGNNRISIRIVKQDQFNAFVLDGRNVFMNHGVLLQAKTPNEVIGVIAHETGHITGGHMASLRAKLAQDQTRSMIMKVLGIGALIAGATSGSQSTKEGLAGAGQGVLLGGDEVLMRSILTYRQAQESGADQAGMTFLTATKQSGLGMLITFEGFAQQEYISDIYKDPYLRSHPMASQRLAQLRTLAEKSPYYNTKDDPSLQARHDLMRAKISGFLERPQATFNRYPASDTSLAARYARSIARFYMGGGQSAMPEVEALIREKPDNPYFLEVKGQFLMESGKNREALEPLRRSLKLLGDGGGQIRVRLAQALLGTDDPKVVDESIEHLRRSMVDDPDSLAYSLLASAYYKKGMGPEADLAAAQARFYEGDLKKAKEFALRAQRRFGAGSPGWTKCQDIINFKPADS